MNHDTSELTPQHPDEEALSDAELEAVVAGKRLGRIAMEGRDGWYVPLRNRSARQSA